MAPFSETRVVLSDIVPPSELVTAALALAFDGDRLLMTNLRSRGWDIPGGHVEPGETPEEAMRREVYEETGAHLDTSHFLGYQWIRVLGPKPDGFSYPYPDSYQVFFWASVASLDIFTPTAEAAGRGLFTPEEARGLKWVRQNSDLFAAALRKALG